MKILNFLKTLLPIFGRSKVETDIKQQQDLLKKSLLPFLKRMVDQFHGHPFSADLALPLETAFRRMGGGNSTIVSVLYNIYQQLPAKLDYIGKAVEEEFEVDISRDDLTYKQLQLIRFLEFSRFSVEYTMRLLGRLVAAESRHRLNQQDRIDEQLTPAEIRWLELNLQTYMQILPLLATPMVKFRSALESMPELTVQSGEEGAAGTTFGAAKVDPLQMNFINTNAMNFNLLYHYRLWRAEMEVAHYQLLQQEILALELRLLELKSAQQERQDARLEQQIERREAQLSRTRAQYYEMTEQYGLVP